MQNIFIRSYDVVMYWAKTKHSVKVLSILSFFESFIFPVPPDILLIPLCISNQKKALYFAMLTTIFSVLGGIIGYLIGVFFSDLFLNSLSWLFDKEKVETITLWMFQWGAMVVLISGFSPIPYKIFTVASGVVGLAFIPFLIASFAGRGLRFFLIGFLILKGGDDLEKRLRKFAGVLGWVGLVAMMLYLIISYSNAT